MSDLISTMRSHINSATMPSLQDRETLLRLLTRQQAELAKLRADNKAVSEELSSACTEIAKLREELSQSQATCERLRALLVGWSEEESCDCPECETHGHLRGSCIYCQTKSALAESPADALRAHDLALAERAFMDALRLSHDGVTDPCSPLSFREQLWQQSAIRASLRKEGA